MNWELLDSDFRSAVNTKVSSIEYFKRTHTDKKYNIRLQAMYAHLAEKRLSRVNRRVKNVNRRFENLPDLHQLTAEDLTMAALYELNRRRIEEGMEILDPQERDWTKFESQLIRENNYRKK